MITASIVTVSLPSVNNLLDKLNDLLCVCGYRKHKVAVNCSSLVGRQTCSIELWDLVNVGNLSKGSKEVISRDSRLTLEETKPEDLSVLNTEVCAYLFSQVIVHNILEVNFVEIVCPWVEHREALVLNALLSVLRDVIRDECEVGFISLNWVLEVILNKLFFVISDERSNCFYARGALQVLRFNFGINECN